MKKTILWFMTVMLSFTALGLSPTRGMADSLVYSRHSFPEKTGQGQAYLPTSSEDEQGRQNIGSLQDEEGSISGYVYNEDGSIPIRGARVCIDLGAEKYQISCTTANMDGSYRVDGLMPRPDYVVQANALYYMRTFHWDNGRFGEATQVSVQAGQITSGINILLPNTDSSITGRVTYKDGSAAANVKMRAYGLYNGWSTESKTNANGEYGLRLRSGEGGWFVYPDYPPFKFDLQGFYSSNVSDVDFVLSQPEPFVLVDHNLNNIQVRDFPSNANVTVSVDDPSNGIGVDYSETKALKQFTYVYPPYPGYTYADFNPSLDLKPGFKVTATDGTTAKVLEVTSLMVTKVENSVIGTAEPGVTLRLCVGSGDDDCIWVDADGSGNWIDNDPRFPVISPGTQGYAYISDDDGDRTTWSWARPDPHIVATHNMNYVEAYDFPLSTTVTLSVNGVEKNSKITETKGLNTWAKFDLSFDITPGDIIQMTNGTITKELTIAPLTVTGFDTTLDSLSGTATPDSYVIIKANTNNRGFTVGEDGNWTARLSGSLNLFTGVSGDVRQEDTDGDFSCWYWMIPASSPPNYTISGKVSLPEEDDSGVAVMLVGSSLTPDPYTITGLDGSYTLTDIPQGDKGTLVAMKATYSFTPAAITVNSINKNLTGANFTSTSSLPNIIQGTVLVGGTGLGGVKVTFGEYETISASNGSYTITNIPLGSQGTLSASKEGYNLTYAGDKTFPATFTESWVEQNFTAVPTICSISGSVLNGSTGLGGVLVQFAGFKANTAASGAYRLTKIPCGTQGTLSASNEGYTLNYAGSRSFPAKLQENWSNENFSVQKSYRISGNVKVGGDGVAGVTITFDASAVEQQDKITLSGAQGEFVLDVPVNTVGTLTAKLGENVFNYAASGKNRKSFPTALNANWKGQDFDLPGKLMISGMISYHGVGLSGTSVTFDDLNSTTDYTMTSTADGKYVLFVPKDLSGTLGVTDAEHVFKYAASKIKIIDFPAKLAANWNEQNFMAQAKTHIIEGKILSIGGIGLPNVKVSFVDQNHNEYVTYSGENGEYILSGVLHNSYGDLTANLTGFSFQFYQINDPVTTKLSGYNIAATNTPDYAVMHSPCGDTAPANVDFVWADTGTTARYNLLVEYDMNGVWQPLNDFWYEAGTVCSGGECRVTPYKTLAARFYRWSVRGNGTPGWSPTQSFQIKSIGYSPRGNLKKPQGENIPITFKWAPWQQKVNKVLTNVAYYRISLYYGKKVVYDTPGNWYIAEEICQTEECSLTLDFSAKQLGYGAYTWKVQGSNNYTSGTPAKSKHLLSAQLLGGSFNFGPAEITGMKASVFDGTDGSIIFIWNRSSDADSYVILVEKKDGYSGLWKKYQQVMFNSSKKVSVKGNTLFECEDILCFYCPQANWPESYYRWSVQGRNYSLVGKSKVYGSGPLAVDEFIAGTPLVTPQPVSPLGAVAKPDAGQQMFSWEQSTRVDFYSYRFMITGGKTNMEFDISYLDPALSCANQICTYTLSKTLDYGNYTFSLQEKTQNAASKPSAKVKFSYGPAKPTGLNPANGSSTADTTPDITWGAVSEAGKYNLRLLKQVGATWVQVTANNGLAASKYCVGATCTFPYPKVLLVGVTYRCEVAGVTPKGAAGPSAATQFTITP